jgi:hypothetical protein
MFVQHLARASVHHSMGPRKSRKSRKSKSRKSNRSKPRKSRKSKSRKSRKSKSRKSKSKKGGGYTLQVEGPTVGGQPPRMGYSECCPPLYQNGNVAYNANGNRMCGGGKKVKRRKLKSRNKRH